MSTATQKRIAASSLRWYADEIEPALDDIPGLSHQAWDCPAGDDFDSETLSKQTSLGSAAGTLRTVAGLLEAAADAQEAEEAAAAAAAAAANGDAGDAGTSEVDAGAGSRYVPSSVW